MRIHGFALLLLLGSTTLAATPPDATSSAGEIDVDAMARAKDVKTGGPDATPSPTTDPAPTTSVPGEASPPSTPQAPDDTPSAVADRAAAPQDRLETDPATSQPPADEAAADDAADDAVPAGDASKTATAEPPGDPAAPEKADAPAEAAASQASSAERRRADACVARAGALLDAAQAHDYDKATRDFDAKMRSALPVAKFQQAWESLAQFGKLTARGQTHPGSHEGYVVVTIPMVFEKANLYAQVSCGSDGRIAGFYVKPLELPSP
jgi:hypothetical protein